MATTKSIVNKYCQLLNNELSGRFNSIDLPKIIYHLCERGIIKQKTIRDRVVLIEYTEMLSKTKFGSTAVIEELCEKFKISKRRFYEILKEKKKFSAHNNIV